MGASRSSAGRGEEIDDSPGRHAARPPTDDPAPDPAGDDKFDDGWLRTGDIASIDERGYIRISDRAKDVIKSGGEWISSVELENELMGHPAVAEAALIALSDERWSERPLACIVRDSDADGAAAELP